MSVDWSALVAATVRVIGVRTGTGVLVDRHLVLSAAHLVDHGADRPVLVEFPQLSGRPGLHARVVPPLVGDGPATDLMVLRLLDPPADLPAPPALWASAREPEQVQLFGYPSQDRTLAGVHRRYEVAGPTTGATVQLRWAEDAGALPGHSGSPVVDRWTGEVAGVLLEGSEHGRFDRYAPIRLAQRSWPRLPRPWLVVGGEGRGHFERGSRGQRGDRSRDEDLFRGRERALAAVQAWWCDAQARRCALVVTGQPGAGKTAVLTRAVLGLEAAQRASGLAFHARGTTHREMLDALGALACTAADPSPRQVVDALDRPPPDGPRHWRIAVDGLDEAGAELRDMARTLRHVAALDTVRLVIATRRREAHDPSRSEPTTGGLLAALGAASDATIDLDDDRFSDPAGMVAHVGEVLTRPSTSGRAWEAYRDDADLRARLAREIQTRADRNFLVASLAADALRDRRAPVDPGHPAFDPTQIPSTVGEALESYLDSLPVDRRHRRRGVLTALAYARGEGFDHQLWLDVASELGYPSSTAELDELRASAAADYLLQTTWSAAGDRRVVRLFHQALADQLLAERDALADQAAVVTLLRGAVDHAEPSVRRAYARFHLAGHAAAAGSLPALLRDTDYLLHADIGQLVPLLRARSVRGEPAAVTVRRSGMRAAPLRAGERAELFALCAAQLGYAALAADLTVRCTAARPRWTHGAPPHLEIVCDHHPVLRLAAGRLHDGRPLLAGTTQDGDIRLWDPDTAAELRTLRGGGGHPWALEFGHLADGRPFLAGRWGGAAVELWDPERGTAIGTLGDEGSGTRAVAVGQMSDGRPAVALGGGRGTVDVRAPDSGELLLRVPVKRSHDLKSLAFGRLADGRAILAGGTDRLVQLWDLDSGDTLHTVDAGPTVGLSRPGEGTPTLVHGFTFRTEMSIADPASGKVRRTVTFDRLNQVEHIAFGRFGGAEVMAVTGSSPTVRLWDVESATELPPLTEHTGRIRSVAFGRFGDGTSMLASAAADGTVRLWDDVAPSRAVRGARHTEPVVAIDCGRLPDGRPVLASAAEDGSVRLWDPETGARWFPDGPSFRMTAYGVAFGRLDDRDVLLSTGYDAPVHVTDLDTGRVLRRIGPGPTCGVKSTNAVAFGRLRDGRPVLAAAGHGDGVGLWDLGSGAALHEFDPGTGDADALAFGRRGDGRWALGIAGRDVVSIGDPDTGRLRAVTGPDARPTALAFGHDHTGRLLLASGHEDGAVRLVDAESGVERQRLDGHRDAITSMAVHSASDGRCIVIGAARDGTIRFWGTASGQPLHVLTLPGTPLALAVSGDGLFVAVGAILCRVDLDLELD